MFIASLILFCQKPVAYKQLQLKNGLKIYLIQKESPVTSVIFRLKCGTIQGAPQLAALTNRMLLKGTEVRSGYQIFEEIESLGGRLGTEESKTSNLVYLAAPSENFAECFKIFNECLCKPTFDNHLAAISELKKINQSAEHILFSKQMTKNQEKAIYQYLFQNSPLQNEDVAVEDLYSQEEMFSFYEEYYHPANAVMCIVGDFNPSELMSIIKSYWKLKKSDKRNNSILDLGQPSKEPVYLNDGDSEYDRLFIAYQAAEAFGEDFYECCTIRRALASGPNSLFYQSLNNLDDYHYEPLSFYRYGVDYGYFVIVVETKPGKSDVVLSHLLDKIEMIKKHGLSEKYFKVAKRKLISDISNHFQYTLKNAYMLSLAVMNDEANFNRFPPYTELKSIELSAVNQAVNTLFRDPVILLYNKSN